MINYDCRHYIGRKPCVHKRTCADCPRYEIVKSRILIIKLGALGDLLRTTTILPALKKAYPGSQITWLTQPNCLPLLQNNEFIDRIWLTDENALSRVTAQKFDLVINFDKETPAVELATLANSEDKRGFGLSPNGSLMAFNSASNYSLELGINDDLKFRINKKTYQELIHEMADLPFQSSPPQYVFNLTEKETEFAKRWIASNQAQQAGKLLLAINAGCGKIFATKKWHTDRFVEVAARAFQELGAVPVIFGGLDEVELNDYICEELKKCDTPVIRPGEQLSLREFTALVSQCDAMICGDTLAMHVALSQKVNAVVIFTSTCASEIELYGKGSAIVGQAACAPCYLSKCKQSAQYCADNISVDDVINALKGQLEKVVNI